MYRMRCCREDGLLLLKKLLPFKDSNVKALREFIVINNDIINPIWEAVSKTGHYAFEPV
jgi:hypothetical protein